MFASVTSCLSWNSLNNRHWSGPALWYATIIFSLSCIFTGAQQSLVLPEADSIEKLTSEELERMKQSFAASKQRSSQPSRLSLFAWQIPLMLLGYAVVTFLGGLCSVVLSPLARNPGWNDETKVRTLFNQQFCRLILNRLQYCSSVSGCSPSSVGCFHHLLFIE